MDDVDDPRDVRANLLAQMGLTDASRVVQDRSLIEAGFPTSDTINLHILNHPKYNDTPSQEFERLGAAIGGSNHFKKLKLPLLYCVLNDANLEVFFRGLMPNRSIEEVTFEPHTLSKVGGKVLQLLISFLKDNGSITDLTVRQNYSGENWRGSNDVIRAVLEACSLLKKISFNSCIMPTLFNNMAKEFFPMLRGLEHLERLDFQSSVYGYRGSKLDLDGYSELGNLLTDPLFKLSHLGLRLWMIEDDAVVKLINDLRRNDQLTSLKIIYDHQEKNWKDTSSKVLCDSVLKTLRLYNHALTRMSVSFRNDDDDYTSVDHLNLPDEIQYLLQRNCQNDKESIRIRKSMDYNFLIPERGLQNMPFDDEEFDVRLLPYVLSSISNQRSERDVRSQNFRFAGLNHFIQTRHLLVLCMRRK